MKRKLKIMTHQVDQLKEEISTKEAALVKLHLEQQRIEKEKETLKVPGWHLPGGGSFLLTGSSKSNQGRLLVVSVANLQKPPTPGPGRITSAVSGMVMIIGDGPRPAGEETGGGPQLLAHL